MAKSKSNRIIATPSAYAKSHYLYVQEVGSLQSIEPHVSKRVNLASYLFFVVLKGSGSLFYEGKKYPLVAGDCIFVNCRREYAHESSIQDPWELSWVHFYGAGADAFYENYADQGNSFLFHPTSASTFLECIDQLYETTRLQKAHAELLCHKYLTDLIYQCFVQAGAREISSDRSMDDKISQIREYIDSHFASRLSLEELSEHFFISKYHLAREFKRITGITFGSYLLGKRISHAKQLLRFSSEPIDFISRDCGISDTGYFIKVFKKSEGMTPNQYRKKW